MSDTLDNSGIIPKHIAIIMDGNGRWASERSLPRVAGHRQGVQSLRRAVRAADELGVKYLTIYSFSSENWSRPESEIDHLFGLLRRFVSQDVAELHASDIRIRIIGERAVLKDDIVELIEYCEELTSDNKGMTLVVAFNYGSRQELVTSVRQIARQIAAGTLQPDEISADMITDNLSTKDIPDPDLLIRTSGEQRLSNFLLWQCAYTEFVFVREHWPAFNKDSMIKAIEIYSNRDRRFGGLKAKAL